jgi:hypothetical protein
MTRDEVISKIKKLLRLKHGGTPDEIAKAMMLAQNLAEKYGVELDSVNADLNVDRHTVRHSELKRYGRIPAAVKVAAAVVKRHFDVDFIITGGDTWRQRFVLNIVGHDIERLLAGHLVIYLARAMGRACAAVKPRSRNAFLLGFADGVDAAVARLRPARPTNEALALSLHGYMTQHFGKTQKHGAPITAGKASASNNAGWRAGRNTAVNRPVHSGPSAAPQLVNGKALPA